MIIAFSFGARRRARCSGRDVKTRDVRPVRRARGFTLLELLMAIVLTAVAVAIAAGALRAASDARVRVATHREHLERETRLRSALSDMLRHAPSAESVLEPLLVTDADARGTTRLVFLSQGVRAPFGTGRIWRVELSVDQDSLVLAAWPHVQDRRGMPTTPTLRSAVSGISQLRVHFQERASRTDRAAWREDWPLTTTRPAAIRLSFGDDVAHPPLVVTLDPLATVASLTMGIALAGRP